MKNIKWLISLASKRPLVFSLALLMIAVSTLAIVVANREQKVTDCNVERKFIEEYYRVKFDSLSLYYRGREAQYNTEMKNALTFIIEDYREQLEEQKQINERMMKALNKIKSSK